MANSTRILVLSIAAVALSLGTSAVTRSAATSLCTAEAAQLIAPQGMKIGPINDLNPNLPVTATGALLVPATDRRPTYCLVTGSIITNPITGKSANFGLALPLEWNNKFLFSGCGGYCGVVFQCRESYAR